MSPQTATAPVRRRSPASDKSSPGRARHKSAPLTVVEPRRKLMRLVGTIALMSLFGVLLLMAMFHALIVQGQRELDRVNAEIDVATVRNDQLLLDLAEMEAPERIVDAARSFGMVDAPEVVYLSPENSLPLVGTDGDDGQ